MQKLKYSSHTIFILIATLFVVNGNAASAPDYQLVKDTGVSLAEGRKVQWTEWRHEGQGFSTGINHYRSQSGESEAVLFYLPGTNMNGFLKTPDENHNLWLFLAARGVEVYAMDYRTRFIPHDFAGDLSVMETWTMEAFVDDAVKATRFVRDQQGDLPLFIAGFSRGAGYAYALAGQIDAAGLIVLDGGFKQVEEKDYDRAAAMKELKEAGKFASAVSRRGYPRRHELMQRAINSPGGPATDDRYASAAEHLSSVLYRAWGPGVLANTKDGLSDLDVLAREMDSYDWFFPLIQDIEARAIAGSKDDPDTALDDHFGEMTMPVIYFGTTNFGADSLISGIHSASRSGSKDVTIHVLENYGHLDLLFAKDAKRQVYEPILGWIREKVR